MSWKNNAAMAWNGNKVTDHGRSEIDESYESFDSDRRTANGTLRRYHVARKRSWSVNWEMLPSKRNVVIGGKTYLTTVDNGWAGEEIESFYKSNPGDFVLVLRKGSAINKSTPAMATLPFENDDFFGVRVMFTEFSKTIVKRGPGIDFWNLSVTMEEV